MGCWKAKSHWMTSTKEGVRIVGSGGAMEKRVCMSPDQMWLEWRKVEKKLQSKKPKPVKTQDGLSTRNLIAALSIVYVVLCSSSSLAAYLESCLSPCITLIAALVGIPLLAASHRFANEQTMGSFQDGAALAALDEWKSAVGISDQAIPEVRVALEKSLSREESDRSSFLSITLTVLTAGVLTCALAIVSPYAGSWGWRLYTAVISAILLLILLAVIWMLRMRNAFFSFWHKCPIESLRLLEDCLVVDAIFGDRPSESSPTESD